MPNGNETTQDLLAAIKRERAQLDGRLGQLSDQNMLTPAREDGWTAKDVLAHLTAWEQRLLRWIERWHETGDPGRPEVGVTWADFDGLNERDYAAAKENPLADVRREARESYEAVLLAIKALSDDQMATRPEASDGPSWSWIVSANTYRHYREHRAEMEAWWEKNGR
ncbi:MAG: ClbS/DfsB family four-helix bundle protein [Chloroflexi bacterium]|nr:ClbS/DfsB family four-helix bundle protein [Chloroflexota bacterium]